MTEPQEIDFTYKQPKKIRITVEKVSDHPEHGVCHCHKKGDVFQADFERCPGDICAAAWNSMWPHVRVLELGGRHPWDSVEGVTRVGCPDPDKPVIFKIEALA